MMDNNQQPPSFREYWRLVCRRRLSCAVFFCTVIGLTVTGILLTPRKFESEAKLYVKENLRLDPSATDERQPVAFDSEREAEMRSVMALLDSRALYERVVAKVGPPLVLEADLGRQPIDHAAEFLTSFLPASASDAGEAEREKAIRRLDQVLEIEHPRKSHVIVLVYKSRSPERAQQVLDAYVDLVLRQHAEVNRNPESYQFFVEQEALLKQQVMAAKESLRDAKNEVGLISVDSRRKLMEDHISNLDREILSVQTQLAASREQIGKLRAQLPLELQQPSAVSSLSIRSLDEMRAQLFTAELQYREFRAIYQPVHPRIVAVKKQIEEAEIVLNQQQLLNELTNLDGLNSKRAALLADYELTKGQLTELNVDEVQILELERQAEEVTANHRLYAKKLEQARLDQRLESDRITNLRLAEAPTRMSRPVRRGGLMILAVASLFAVVGSVGFATLLEQASPADRRQRSPANGRTLLRNHSGAAAVTIGRGAEEPSPHA